MATKVEYQHQWSVPSETDDTKVYKVSLTKEGEYKCSCPRWIFKREQCKHIIRVKNGEIDEPISNLVIVLYNCEQVELGKGKKKGEIHFPLIPIGDSHFLLTLLYDATKYGVPWSILRERYDLPSSLKRSDVENYIERHGRKIYGDWVKGKGHQGFKIIQIG